jgi:hypothetical protein
MGTGRSPPTTEQMLAVVANVSGTVIRLRQFDALHHSAPVTARSGASPGSLAYPGLEAPLAPQVGEGAQA